MFGPAEALRDAHHVRVDDDAFRRAESDAEHHVRRLAHAGSSTSSASVRGTSPRRFSIKRRARLMMFFAFWLYFRAL